MTRASLLAGILVLSATLLAGCAGGSDVVGKQAPDFTLTDLDGVNHTLSAYAGKPVFLFFMASWCSTCAHYSRSDLQEIHSELDAAGGVVLAISVDPLDNARKLRTFNERNGVGWPTALDTAGVTRSYEIWATSIGVAVSPEQEILLAEIDPSKEKVLGLLAA